ncbi:MAG: TIGR01244 family phosphatase [Pelagibacterales bacterium]|mgnify:FL=1|nr:TIGR01244 family phosphatase [Pelagibacterales bacterium]
MADLIKIEDITIRKIDKNQYVSGQITIDVIEEIAKYGITLIINNRPDNEEVDQVRSEELKLKAKSLGIKFIDIPFSGNSLTKENIIDFSKLIKNSYDEKSLFFCRSGARSSTIWGLASVLYLDLNIVDVMNKINDIGYDSTVLPNMVEYFKNN